MEQKPDLLLFSREHEEQQAAQIALARQLCQDARRLRAEARRLLEERRQLIARVQADLIRR